MRANVRTNLSLYEFFYYVGYHPQYAAQIGINVPFLTQPACSDVMYQYFWQKSDTLAREHFAEAIRQAEELIAAMIGYETAPRFIVAEPVNYPESFDRTAWGTFWQPNGKLKAIKVRSGEIQNIGVESLTVAGSAAAVAYSDKDGDGILDTFTVTATVAAGTLAKNVALFFVSGDRGQLQLLDCEIRPLNVSISGTTATITGPRELMVKPTAQIAIAPSSLDILLATGFATTVDVYIRTVDPSDAGTLIWENVLASWYLAFYGTSCSPPCSVSVKTGCFGVRDKSAGWIVPRPAEYDADTSAFIAICGAQYRSPDRVTVNYYAGYPRQNNGWVDARLARATTLLAAALLPRKSCGCELTQQYLHELRNLPVDDQGRLQVSQRDLDRASEFFGSTFRGAVEAAKLLQNEIAWGAVDLG